ncbi:helix-turn-helix domain-containing protein [Dactylosporangium sp. CA-092794]|uniref:AraC family transcriptional regulator n=1 Tax=Dactylosporangium sp. CA-092794 TaxID=3239929 RepID=UPI003D924606
MFDSVHFDLTPYAGFDMDAYVRRTHCSWSHNGWQSLLVQRFDHVAEVEAMALPAVADVHLILPVAGRAVMESSDGGRWHRRTWAPERLEMAVPHRPAVRRYRAERSMSSVQVHLPHGTVDRVATQLGCRGLDMEAVAASVAVGDPLLTAMMRALSTRDETDELYAESAAEFMAVHLLTRHARTPVPPDRVLRDRRVQRVVAVMRDRLADPLTLADLAVEVHLSPYHLLRVFKETTGETPHRFLTRLRITEAQRLLRDTDLALADIAARCGFAGPGSFSTTFLRHVGVRPSAYRDAG